MSDSNPKTDAGPLERMFVGFVGKLGAVAKREAAQSVREAGGQPVDLADDRLNLVVIGAEESPLALEADLLAETLQQRVAAGELELIHETEFWRRVGVIDDQGHQDRLYTPAMLAELLDVPLPIIRRWARRGLIVPSHEVHRLPYFSFQEVSTARTLARLLAAGATPQAIEKKLSRLAKFLPDVDRPLAQLSVIIEGRELLLRQGDGLLEPGGQLRFDFAALERTHDSDAPFDDESASVESTDEEREDEPATLQICPPFDQAPIETPEEFRHLAARYEDEGRLDAAIEAVRAALAAGGPCPETNFQLAELLYRIGDLSAARERYYAAIECDEQFVEARHNLGCLLAELGQHDLAAAAFEGAISIHADYADAHFHLANSLEALDQHGEAAVHWRRFLELAPDSPWADEARDRL